MDLTLRGKYKDQLFTWRHHPAKCATAKPQSLPFCCEGTYKKSLNYFSSYTKGMHGQWFSVCNYDELILTPLLNTSAIMTQITTLLVDSYLVVTYLFNLYSGPGSWNFSLYILGVYNQTKFNTIQVKEKLSPYVHEGKIPFKE